MRRPIATLLLMLLMLSSVVWGQTQSPASSRGPSSSMNTSQHNMSGMKEMPMNSDKDESEASAHVMHSMEGHMDMGPHMKMTALAEPKPGDQARAQRVVEAARQAADKYFDYRVALANGFKIFHPEIPQKIYHFTNPGYAMEAQFHFNAEHPTSLLYEKHGDDYKLVGVMYTAPKRFTEHQLDERIPLSVAQWHEHVNFCVPPADKRKEMLGPHPEFGLRGSIATEDRCNAAGGRFLPVVFNWMVHVYPFEKDPGSIWSVERQHGDND